MRDASFARCPWRLELLGTPRLIGSNGEVRLERRTSAALAYLALEGSAVKYRLAGWLWPESTERAARANMRQLLRRLRVSTSDDLVLGTDTIRLAPTVATDVGEMRRFAFDEAYGDLLSVPGDLLEGLESDDLPDFAEWLAFERERVKQLRLLAAARHAEHLERAGDLVGALHASQRALTLEPLSEEAHRALMRLHHLRGDRAAAMDAYRRLERLLRDTLGTEPLPVTKALAGEIARGSVVPTAGAATSPLAVQRPFTLVGREDAWARLEGAWAVKRVAVLAGEAGAGKTRLALDFASSRGVYVHLEARPGDADVPYATAARWTRTLLGLPGRRERLPAWTTSELARLIPEFGVALPLASPDGKLRFFDAVVEACRGFVGVLVLDDLHFADDATLELAGYVLRTLVFEADAPRFLATHRTDEASETCVRVLQALVEADAAEAIDVPTLDESAVARLLDTLELPSATFAEKLTRYTGGNPLFVVETLKHLYETGLVAHGFPDALPPPERAGNVIRRRVRRLSREAQQVARAASVLRRDFDVELLSEVLGVSVLDVLQVWDELEAARLMSGARFVHDIVQEAVLTDTPPAVREVLHRAAARALEARSGDSARVALHWKAGGEPRRAAPLLLLAAARAGEFLRFTDAARFYAAAAACFDGVGEDDAAFEARAAIFERLWLHDLREVLDDERSRLQSGARSALQIARSCAADAVTRLVRHRDGVGAEEAARQGLNALEGAPMVEQATALEVELRRLVIEARVALGRTEGLRDLIARALEVARMSSDRRLAATLDLTVGVALFSTWQDERAVERFLSAASTAEAHGDRYGANLARQNAATVLEHVGQRERAERLRLEVRTHLGATPGTTRVAYLNAVGLGKNFMIRHRYARAAEQFEVARALSRDLEASSGLVERAAAQLSWMLGDLGACEAAARRALAAPDPDAGAFGEAHLWLGRVFAAGGRFEEARASFDEAEARTRTRSLPSTLGSLRLARLAIAPPDETLALADEAVAFARRHGQEELLTAALAERASALLQRGRFTQALASARDAADRWERTPPRDDVLKPLLVYALAHAAVGEWPGVTLQRAAAWLDHALSVNVPAAFAATFRARPTHARLLELAHEAATATKRNREPKR
ncbi:BTAD domain-containing putative transcriptional regulator [Deinococcus yavapaiensis]|uniref:AAA ATPase-like protein n=1 Tax=Deinococcus yavapaiensis KR-236 TaxID=694435 RepID=A0A318S518_9DEIO|nr:BTAD domain-containing putative transcriptional regulator [Deinococcus yavapaiensis]PYE48643.1 AAA ATPase-like protein [Deinococcus yavapaiensis KR-236]